MGRQFANVGSGNTASVDKTGDFHTSIGGQIFDKSVVEDVAADLHRGIGHHGFHNVGSVFSASVVLLNAVNEKLLVFLLPALDLIDTTSGIFIQRNVILFYKLGVFGFDIERSIFRVVLTGFGAVIPKILDIIEAYLIPK